MQQKTSCTCSDWARGVGKTLCDVPMRLCSLCARCFALACRVPLYIQTSHGPRAQGVHGGGVSTSTHPVCPVAQCEPVKV